MPNDSVDKANLAITDINKGTAYFADNVLTFSGWDNNRNFGDSTCVTHYLAPIRAGSIWSCGIVSDRRLRCWLP
jgi:hypothetical protein